MLPHEEYCPFKTTLCFVKFKKSVMISKSFPELPFVLVCTRDPCVIPYHMFLKCIKTYPEPQDHRQKVSKFHE